LIKQIKNNTNFQLQQSTQNKLKNRHTEPKSRPAAKANCTVLACAAAEINAWALQTSDDEETDRSETLSREEKLQSGERADGLSHGPIGPTDCLTGQSGRDENGVSVRAVKKTKTGYLSGR
jgi:predicted outer membrane lipoprotein